MLLELPSRSESNRQTACFQAFQRLLCVCFRHQYHALHMFGEREVVVGFNLLDLVSVSSEAVEVDAERFGIA